MDPRHHVVVWQGCSAPPLDERASAHVMLGVFDLTVPTPAPALLHCPLKNDGADSRFPLWPILTVRTAYRPEDEVEDYGEVIESDCGLDVTNVVRQRRDSSTLVL